MAQLRGKELDVYLEKSLVECWKISTMDGGSYVYTQLAFSKHTKVSRETIRRKQSFIDGVLERLNLTRRKSEGRKIYSELQLEISRLVSLHEQLENKYASLRTNHLLIFSSLRASSYDMSKLLAEIELSHYKNNDVCFFCGSLMLSPSD